eukprot:jgi/Galph1/1611/GphlegSOOS_G276.1
MASLTNLLKQAAADKYNQGNFRDHWEILESLGRGTFAKVYVAMRKKVESNETQFGAVKIVPKKTIFEGHDSAVLLAREIKALRLAGNGNEFVVEFYEVFEDVDNVYVVLQNLLRGGELFDKIIERGHFDESDACDIAYRLVCSVYQCHLVHVVHRDLKPENFVFENDEENCKLKLVDFGLANIFSSNNSAFYTLCGSPSYIAPEILFQKPYTAKVDIWSLGVIIHVVLSGHAPFEHRDEKELFYKIKREPVVLRGESWNNISDEAKDLVLHMLCKDPNLRPSIDWCYNHPWIRQRREHDAVVRRKNNLPMTLRSLQNFDARDKWDASVKKVEIVNRLSHLAEIHQRVVHASTEVTVSSSFDLEEVEERSMTLFEESPEDRPVKLVNTQTIKVSDSNQERPQQMIGATCDDDTKRYQHFVGKKTKSIPTSTLESDVTREPIFACGICSIH